MGKFQDFRSLQGEGYSLYHVRSQGSSFSKGGGGGVGVRNLGI